MVKDFLSYAVGCIFGRYSPEKPGLILANANSTFEEYEKLLPDRKYSADDDGCVLLVTEYAHKDGTLAEKFKGFLKFTFGEENYRNNLSFIEQTLDCSVEEYFSKQFFKDHWKRYGGRPIYWLFSSPKGSFKALIYMHRYHPDTVGKLLRDYFTPYRSNIERNYQILASQQDGTLSAKDLKTKNLLGKQLVELNEYENEVLRPLVNKRISIDLDDGVLANYQLFGKALKNE